LRIEAIRVLGVIGESRALGQLLAALVDPDPRVSARAARAIGKIGDPRAYHPLLTALHHPEPDVRYEACRALADLRFPECIDSLLELAERETDLTTWGASVSEMARRAATEIRSATSSSTLDDDLTEIVKALEEQSYLHHES